MIGRLNHVAIAVKDLEKSAALYRDTLGAKVSAPQAEPAHGVTVVFIELPNTKIELLQPLGENSPIAKFLEKNPDGGMHHVVHFGDDIGFYHPARAGRHGVVERLAPLPLDAHARRRPARARRRCAPADAGRAAQACVW